MAEENGNAVDLSGLGSFEFAPGWAKRAEKVSVGSVSPGRNREQSQEGRPPKAFSGQRQGGAGKPKPRGFERSGGQRPAFRERVRPLDCEIKILPEPKALGTIFRKIQSDAHAFKLKDIAGFLLDNPESILLKIVPKEPGGLYQCKACGFAAVSQAEVCDHAMSAHLENYYGSKEVECEPPKGNFNCVARCGLSGVLLGPPNIHEFGSVVREMLRTKYPSMTEDEYRARIEMVRDPEVIEEWRKGATKKTVFFAKSQDGGAAPQDEGELIMMDREQAEGEFRRMILPSLVDAPKHVMITAAAAMKSPSASLAMAVRNAVDAERRAPYNMCFALRGAFHHRKLKFFRANDSRGPEFVTNVEYRQFDADHAIPELATAARFVAENPCCDKSEFPKDIADFEKHLAWLVTTGHVVAFTNGVYSEVEKFPKYGPQWKNRKKKAAPTAQAEAVAEAQPAEEPKAVAEPQAVEEPQAVAEPQDVAEPQNNVQENGQEKDETPTQLAE